MKAWQRGIQYAAIALAITLCIAIVGGIVGGLRFATELLEVWHSRGDVPAGTSSVSDSAIVDNNSYTPSGTVRELELEIGAATLQICTGETFRLETNLKKLTVGEEAGVWVIRQGAERFPTNLSDRYIRLTVPADAALDKVELEAGAGDVDVEALTAAELDLELGAGQFRAGSLTATGKAEIEGGAGRLAIKGGALHDLDMQMGAGKTELHARLSGDCSLDVGMGAAEIALSGSREDYRLRIDKGLGYVTVDGKAVRNGDVIGDGAARVALTGGMGRITVEYTADSTTR